jgi:hypothetical protein
MAGVEPGIAGMRLGGWGTPRTKSSTTWLPDGVAVGLAAPGHSHGVITPTSQILGHLGSAVEGGSGRTRGWSAGFGMRRSRQSPAGRRWRGDWATPEPARLPLAGEERRLGMVENGDRGWWLGTARGWSRWG